ncbi:MAG: class B sortase, partial [Clostridia bacterium]|nr:class B sortase [Clostridia bacterium]
KNKNNKSNSKAQYDAKKKNNSAGATKKSSQSDAKSISDAPADEELIQGSAEADAPDECNAQKPAAGENPSFEKEEVSSDTDEESSPVPEPPFPPAPQVDIPFDPDFSGEDFLASVKDLKAEDIQMPEENNGKTKSKKKLSPLENAIQLTLIFTCAAVAVFCLFLLGKNIWGKIKGEEIYTSTQSQFNGFTLDDVDASSSRGLPYTYSDVPLLTIFERIEAGKSAVQENNGSQYSEQLSQMKASLSALKSKYPDIYGWIYVPDTNINHPIVRCDDNNYYLTHTHTGDYLPVGAIFADLTTLDKVTDNYNTVIYGHNVIAQGYSSMFHDVEKFLDEEFFKSQSIYIYTLDGAYIFKPVAIYDTVADDFYFKTVFTNESEFLSFAKDKISNSNIYTGAALSPGDKMLTLSTCTNGAQDGRYALHAVLIEVIE